VVVGVFEVELVGLVVAVLCGELGLDIFEAECLKLEPDHRAGRILREGLIDLDTDLLAGGELPFDKVIIKDFLCERLSHNTRRWCLRGHKSRVCREKPNQGRQRTVTVSSADDPTAPGVGCGCWLRYCFRHRRRPLSYV
jgi:hypothetical protein